MTLLMKRPVAGESTKKEIQPLQRARLHDQARGIFDYDIEAALKGATYTEKKSRSKGESRQKYKTEQVEKDEMDETDETDEIDEQDERFRRYFPMEQQSGELQQGTKWKQGNPPPYTI